MINCSFTGLNGLNKDCELFLSAVKGFAVADPSQNFATLNAAKALSGWKTAIDTNRKIDVFRALRGAEITDIEPVVETDGFGVDLVTEFNPPKAIFYLSATYSDVIDMSKIGPQTVRVYLFGANGTKMAFQDENGLVKGFEAQAVVVPVSPGKQTDKINQYRMMINFMNVNEFVNAVVWYDGIAHSQYLQYMPDGYKVEIVSALSGSAATVKISKRDGSTLGTDTFTAEIGDTNCPSDASVTVGAITGGQSTLTVYRTGTTAPASGDYITVRFVKKTASVYNQITNYITFRVA